MLNVHELSFRYRRGQPLVLDKVSFSLAEGKVGVVLGRNGSGKTTLFRNLLGMVRPEEGSIRFDRKDILSMNRRERAGLIAFVPQDIRFGALTVYDSVLMGRISRFGVRPGREDYAAVDRILQEMGLTGLAERDADRLSGGERQKAAFARALAQEPKLLLLDEPTGNLDLANEQLVLKMARQLAREKGISVLCSLHDLNQALSFGDEFFFLQDGTIISSGGAEQFSVPLLEKVFQCEIRLIEWNGEKIVLGGPRYEKDHHTP